MSVNCFKCYKELEYAVPNDENAPSGALMFKSYGNYGSRLFDSMSHWMRIYVCDDCVREAVEFVEVGRVTKREKQIVEYQPFNLNQLRDYQ